MIPAQLSHYLLPPPAHLLPPCSLASGEGGHHGGKQLQLNSDRVLGPRTALPPLLASFPLPFPTGGGGRLRLLPQARAGHTDGLQGWSGGTKAYMHPLLRRPEYATFPLRGRLSNIRAGSKGAKLVAENLSLRSRPSMRVREPGGTALLQRLRREDSLSGKHLPRGCRPVTAKGRAQEGSPSRPPAPPGPGSPSGGGAARAHPSLLPGSPSLTRREHRHQH